MLAHQVRHEEYHRQGSFEETAHLLALLIEELKKKKKKKASQYEPMIYELAWY